MLAKRKTSGHLNIFLQRPVHLFPNKIEISFRNHKYDGTLYLQSKNSAIIHLTYITILYTKIYIFASYLKIYAINWKSMQLLEHRNSLFLLPCGFGKIRVLHERLFPCTPKTHVVTFYVINFFKRLYQLPSGFLKVILSSSIKRNLLRKNRGKKKDNDWRK